ncbi:hypothetical protein [Reichenbachiella sp.]|uniref:hypothetical protein n=1 Tax=Reichenbachiella sp. TaxID=2184521 RepID=UPI003BAE2D32
MRISLSETAEIENWLLAKAPSSEQLVTEAKVLTTPSIRDKAKWQSKAYSLIQLYGREKLIEEIKSVEHCVFHEPKFRSFQLRIQSIFKR